MKDLKESIFIRRWNNKPSIQWKDFWKDLLLNKQPPIENKK